jgi:hypothetical protein
MFWPQLFFSVQECYGNTIINDSESLHLSFRFIVVLESITFYPAAISAHGRQGGSTKSWGVHVLILMHTCAFTYSALR